MDRPSASNRTSTAENPDIASHTRIKPLESSDMMYANVLKAAVCQPQLFVEFGCSHTVCEGQRHTLEVSGCGCCGELALVTDRCVAASTALLTPERNEHFAVSRRARAVISFSN